MKFKSILFFMVVTLLSSCGKEEPIIDENPTPTLSVELKEVGIGNSKIVYQDNDLHLDADVQAPDKIASVKLQITLASTNYAWDFVKTYTEGYAGRKEANFHEHVQVPENAPIGEYTALLIVTDEKGKRAQDKVNFEIRRDVALPSISNRSIKSISASILNVSGNILAPNKIQKLEIEVQSSAWTKMFTYTDAEMVGQTSFAFDKDIDMSGAPSGHYHVNIKVTDQVGKSMLYQYHMDR